MEWVKKRFLGSGSYGKVHLAIQPDGKLEIAVKSADLNKSTSLKRERMFLSALKDCPHIVRCFGEDVSFEHEEHVYNLLLEYAPGRTLKHLIKSYDGSMPEPVVARYTYQLLKGIYYMHHLGIVHCDLKPSNVLVFPTGHYNNQGQNQKYKWDRPRGLVQQFRSQFKIRPKKYKLLGVVQQFRNQFKIQPKKYSGIHENPENRLKLCDLGLAKFTNGENFFGDSHRGTLAYAPPESLTRKEYDAPKDIWALGCMVMEMFTGEATWGDVSQTEELVMKIDLTESEIPNDISVTAKDFLEMCLEMDPGKRGTAITLLDHPFVKPFGVLESVEDYDEGLVNPFGWSSVRDLFTTCSHVPIKKRKVCYSIG